MTSVQAKTADLITEEYEGQFREHWTTASFQFAHSLAHHPAFEIPRILSAAKRVSKLYCDAGDVHVDQRWDEIPPSGADVTELINNIETASAWICVNQAQVIPEYNDIVDSILKEAERLSGRDYKPLMKNKELVIFVTSPKRITPYHIDRECSFLLQVRGEKRIHIFDGADRSVVSEAELERFWAVDNNAAQYRQNQQAKAIEYHLKPGNGVHIPVNFPHWVQNGDGISVSVNINFQVLDHIRADVYRANYHLRRFGLRPKPPGHSPRLDRAKGSFFRNANAMRRFIAERRPLNVAHVEKG